MSQNAPTTQTPTKRRMSTPKRIVLFGLSFFLFVVLGALVYTWLPWKPLAHAHLRMGHKLPLNVGHRGAKGLAPENSMPSFAAAQKAGAHGVEFDVIMTRDKQLVVFHDLKLQKRLANKGKIQQMTLAQVRQLDLSVYFRMEYPKSRSLHAFRKVKAPTLTQVFTFYKQHPKVILNVELKNKDPFGGRGVEKRVAKVIQRFGYQKRVIVSSFNPFAIRRFRKIAPHIPTGLIYSKSPKVPIYIRQLWFLGIARPDAMHPNYKIVDKAYMQWARSRGLSVNVWTVNKAEDMRRMIKLGVDMIITDFPDRLAAILAQTQHPKPNTQNPTPHPTTKPTTPK